MRAHTVIDEQCDAPLFAHARARASDPTPSHEAAAGVSEFEHAHYGRIIAALRQGPAGATAIADRCGLHRSEVGKRTSELVRKGRIVEDGIEKNRGGRNETRYRITGPQR